MILLETIRQFVGLYLAYAAAGIFVYWGFFMWFTIRDIRREVEEINRKLDKKEKP